MEIIEEKVMEIEMLERQNEEIEGRADELDKKRLDEVIEIAKRGLKYEKIYEERICTRYGTSNEYYTDSDKKYLKGVCIYEDVIDDIYYNDCEYIKKKELYLMRDGSTKVFKYIEDIERNIDIPDKSTRELDENQNVNQFDIDKVIDSINDLLSERLEELGDRCENQKKRLKKLEKLKLN